MTSLLAKIKPTEKSIQKEYVEKRKRWIEKHDEERAAAVQAKVEAMQRRFGDKDDWYDTFLKIHTALQWSPLTINFDASSWFLKENNYGTYTQMYDRATRDGEMRLKKVGSNMPAGRAVVDDLVTIPDDWASAHRFSQRHRLRNALHATGASAAAQSHKGGSIPSESMRPTLKGSEEDGYHSTNKLFMPKAKQVFAAVNYGRREHGACTSYGFSHLVLRPGLMNNAIYYPGDTFETRALGTRHQATLNTIGTLLRYSTTTLQDELWAACRNGVRRGDTSESALLIEAHIFKTLKISEDVDKVVLSRMPMKDEPALPEAQWRQIIDNAIKWSNRNGVRLTFAAP